MCAYSCHYELATQDIIYGGKVYSVCDQHAANPIPDPNRPDFGPAPHNGTETSEEAAHLIEGKLNQQCFTVLGVVAAAGPQGVTREEVCKRAGILNQAACGRLNALEELGHIVLDGEKRMAETRRLQQVYRLSAFQSAKVAA